MTHASAHAMQVAGICGSLRQGSFTSMALQVALDGAKEAGARTRLIDLRAYHLLLCDGKEEESGYPQDVFTLRADVRAAQGIILAMPEYHGGASGVLKNALDLMGFEEFEGKMLGLVGVSGGGMGAFGAMNSLRAVGRALHAWVVSEQASIPEAWKVFDQSGTLTDHDVEKRLKEVGRQVARFAYLHTSEHAQEFLRAWEGAPVNPGGAKDEQQGGGEYILPIPYQTDAELDRIIYEDILGEAHRIAESRNGFIEADVWSVHDPDRTW